MSVPQNPETIIVKNQYYPNGLKEIDIWKYYQKNKNLLLRGIIGREVMVFFGTKENETTVIRHIKNTPLRISPSTYDSIISGRMLSIHSTMKRHEDFGIVDIDTDDFDKAKEAAIDVYFALDKANFAYDIKIRYTGKTSFHVVCYFRRPNRIENIRFILLDYLSRTPLFDKYDIKSKRSPGKVNLDIMRNVYRGGFITLGSLSTWGLRCMEVTPRQVAHLGGRWQ